MKIYLAYLLVAISSIFGVAIPVELAEAKPPLVVTTSKVISPVAALDCWRRRQAVRLIVAEKLEAEWFTPAFLDAVKGIGLVEFQRNLLMNIAKQRYGNYKSVQLVKGDRYRIIFDRAEPDAVIAQFRIDSIGRIAGIGIIEKKKSKK
jgi:hypothetical protein